MASNDSGNEFEPQQSSGMESRSFDGELQKDANDFHVKDSQWTHARNAINNSTTGDIGKMGNEPANRLCITVPTGYTIIGFIHLIDDKWTVFSTNNISSEIGYFEEKICRYTKIVNDRCLNFKTTNIIYGQSRETYDCSWALYWADGLNPDRYLNIGDINYAPFAQPWPNVPWFCTDGPPQFAQSCQTGGLTPTPCVVCTPTTPLTLVCDRTRLEDFFRPICLKVSKGADGGELLNGSYYAVAAYSVNGQRVTDYSIPSNVQPLFDHNGVGGSLQIEICDIERDTFDEFQLVIVSTIAQQTVASIIGTYSTNETFITLDIINPSLAPATDQEIRALNAVYEKSDAIFNVNQYLIRVAPTAKFQFNYQPLANQISAKWVSVEYPEDYYVKGGSNTGYMRDEVYSFFIRWVYKTGDKSASFHIPGRPKRRDTAGPGAVVPGQTPARGFELFNNGVAALTPLGAADNIEQTLGVLGPVPYTGGNAGPAELWQAWNTASQSPTITPYTLCDGGIVIAEGLMGYWESSEQYPDNKPDIWNASSNIWSCLAPTGCPPPLWPYTGTGLADYDLCGKYIRHHRFPDNDLSPQASHFRDRGATPSTLSNPNVRHIRIMGVKFENIRPPVDNDGNLIPNIVGYEILRGSRVGNRSVIAKGIINNMWEYDLQIENNTSSLKGLFQNYPYNDLHANQYLSTSKTRNDSLNPHSNPNGANFYNDVKDNIFSFHSPDTNFANPYLSSSELKIYQDYSGLANINIGYVDKHPRTIFLKDFAVILSIIGGIGAAFLATTGKQATNRTRRGNISNFPLTLTDYEYTDRYTFNVSGYTNGALNQNNTESYNNEDPHPLAQDGANEMLNQINPDIEGDEDSWFAANNPLGVPGFLTENALGGRGYSKKSNTFVQSMNQFDVDVYDVNQNIGIMYNARYNYEWGMSDYIPTTLYTLPSFLGIASGGGQPSFMYYLNEGAETTWRALYTFSTPQRHELQHRSHCLYDSWTPRGWNQKRRIILNQAYIDNQVNSFTQQYQVNNLYRGRFVAMQINGAYNPPFVIDETLNDTRLRDIANTADDYRDVNENFQRDSSTYYAAIKQRLRNQYGQLQSIIQVPISCAINICPVSDAPGGNNGLRTVPEGYEGLRLPPLSQCTPDQRIEEGDFPLPGSIGPDPAFGPPPAPTYSWVTNATTQYWTQANVTLAGNNYNVASNQNNAVVIEPIGTQLDLTQYFSAAWGNNLVPGGILANNVPIQNFSYDIIDFPTTDGWKLETWLGDPDLIGPTGGQRVHTYTAGGGAGLGTLYSVFITTPTSNTTTPLSGTLDRLVFRVVPDDDFEPENSIAQLSSFSNRINNTNIITKTLNWYAQAYYNIWIPPYTNSTGDNFQEGDLTQIRVTAPNINTNYDLYDGNGTTLNEITFWQSWNGDPASWQCNFGTKANSYIKDLNCPTRVSWKIDLQARTVPLYAFYDLCTDNSSPYTPVRSNTCCYSIPNVNPLAQPDCSQAISAWQTFYSTGLSPSTNTACGDPDTAIYPRIDFPSNSLPFFGPDSYNTNALPPSPNNPSVRNNPCGCPGSIRISLRTIVGIDPGFIGYLQTWILDETLQGGTAGNYYKLNRDPEEADPFIQISNAVSGFLEGSYVITPGTYGNPADERHIIVVETEECQFIWGGIEVTLDTCVYHPPINITNVCLRVANVPPLQAGCTDPAAVNFNPTAASPNGCCQYAACLDPTALNFIGNNPNLGQACNNIFQYVACTNNCCIPNNPTVTNPGTLTIGVAVGYCNWPCILGTGITQAGNATYDPLTGQLQCPTVLSYSSYPLFGGDTYINRYTEKNNFFYFLDWMYDLPDRTEWDYLKYRMFPYPSYWYNSEGISLTEIVQSWYQFLTSPFNWGPVGVSNLLYPSKFHCMDRPQFQIGLTVKYGYIYLFNSGVRDFFVESEYNVDLRDFGDEITQRHYQEKGKDAFTDIYQMFNSGVIRAGNYYKYDTSLSIGKISYTYDPWGIMYPPSYDPDVAETCYQYLPQKLIYSLPVSQSIVRDNWRIYLTDNARSFKTNINCVKAIYKSGILILFDSDSPVTYQGSDQLQTNLTTDLIIGNGGLFTQPEQSIMNADNIFQFGSCQNKLSVVNTPVGVFWVDAKQGKIFQFSSGMEEISTMNMKWWLSQFLPFQLLKYFPNYQLADNPVAGVGVQTVYDNVNALVYFCKKDWKPILNSAGNPLINYDDVRNEFYVTVGGVRVIKQLGDPQYFESASWTISYDVKTKGWVSFHDWHPQLSSGNTNHFMTSKDNGIWMHNDRFDLYTNYYGVGYDFEIEYLVNTVQEVNTLRSIEYQLEVYRYKQNGYDRHHVLDSNFDEAIVYNTEQCSGLLKLNLMPKNKGPLLTTFPRVNPTNIQILYSKEENKYRFNQFWDATRDRGEFVWNPALVTPTNPTGLTEPPSPQPAALPNVTLGGDIAGLRTQSIFNTEPNGYRRLLNAFNLQYTQKSQLERKKFRHYTTSVILRKKWTRLSGPNKMLISIANNKLLKSQR